MEWSDAVDILLEMSRGSLEDESLKPLFRDFYASAVRHSHLLAEWALAGRDARKAMEHSVLLSRDTLLESLNLLSRDMQARGKNMGWRDRLGDERLSIGDLACYCSAVIALTGGIPFRAEMWPFAEE